MANSVDVEMESCEPDSTVEVEDPQQAVVIQEPTPLQAMRRQLVERQHLCAIMVAASIRERNRVKSELEEARRQRESVVADFHVVFKLSATATQSCMNAKASLEEAINKRYSLLKEIEAEKMWRPPSVEMCQKKQQELKERVAHMRTILGKGSIRTPDD